MSLSHWNSGPPTESSVLLLPPLCPPSLQSDAVVDLVMQTMAMEMLKRWIMNWKMATKQRTATVRRHDPSSAGGAAAGTGTGIVRVLSV